LILSKQFGVVWDKSITISKTHAVDKLFWFIIILFYFLLKDVKTKKLTTDY